jgi:hypothetical protein
MSASLETALQEMLRERASDIETLPAHLGELDRDETLSWRPDRRRDHSRWLLVAAAAVVLAIAGSIIGIRSATEHGPTNTPATKPASPAVTTTAPAPRVLAGLQWTIGVDVPSGYQLHERAYTPHYQSISLLKLGATDSTGCCGSQVFVTLYEPGAYDAAGVTSGQSVLVGNAKGWFGKRPSGSFDGMVPVSNDSLPTLSWQYAPNAWAIARGNAPSTQQLKQLLIIASSIHPSTSSSISTPLRLSYLPPGLNPVRIYQDLTQAYGTTFDFTDGKPGADRTTDLDVQVWSDAGPHEDLTGSTSITAGGRSGHLLDPHGYGQSAEFPLGTHSVVIGLDGPTVTAAQFQQVLSGLQWSSDPTDPSTWFDARTMLP